MINKIFIHTSASKYGSADIIRKWHVQNGWDDIGYHYVINNGRTYSSLHYDTDSDGLIEPGRHESLAGAHVRGHNRNSLGVCLVGRDGSYTDAQMVALYTLVSGLMLRYGVPVDGVLGHYEVDPRKTCPDLDMIELRASLDRLTDQLCREMVC